jgi:hypothetical protein
LAATSCRRWSRAANRSYGSNIFKQLYIYGALDLTPTVLKRLAFGFQWSVSGWLLTPFLQKAGRDVGARLRQRVVTNGLANLAYNMRRVIWLRIKCMRAWGRNPSGAHAEWKPLSSTAASERILSRATFRANKDHGY